ncbi:hypothetical protein LX32DRAFT_730978 [Colletotrichum zoysiae]|uniref:Uncharacterized protein n=1 Tax=Colletotrichum zoysiae TaxID=1216348 RepID=A0AAD9LY58_9PEZI|nr:hypothetical protein LX32DRAFT_730978 [Colletotrichum zoysiae]
MCKDHDLVGNAVGHLIIFNTGPPPPSYKPTRARPSATSNSPRPPAANSNGAILNLGGARHCLPVLRLPRPHPYAEVVTACMATRYAVGIHDTIPESLVSRFLPADTPMPSRLNVIHGNHFHVSAVATLADGEDARPLTSSQNDGPRSDAESRRRQLLRTGRPSAASAVATTPAASESTRSFRTREFRQSESRRLAGRGYTSRREQSCPLQ